MFLLRKFVQFIFLLTRWLFAAKWKWCLLSPSNTRLYVPFCRNTKSKFVPFHDVKASYLYFAMVDQQCQVPGKPPAKDWLNAIKKYYPEYEAQFPTWDSTAKLYFNSLMRKHGQDPEDDNAQDYFCIGTYAPPVDCERADKSRQALKYGDAASAEGDKEKARVCWRKAIELATESNDGKPPVDPEGATAAIIAQKRLQTNETTCKTSADGLAAISRDYKARSGDLIHVRVLQQALRALGHYEGNLDGELSPQTRAAIRKFQREREEDETDTLTPEQNVSLICSAAETSRDLVSETTLGIMYATGLGVEQNMDRAQYWLMQASNQHYADATYNLAVLYGTGIILDSYRLCDVPRAPEQADKYLQEAASQGQPIAVALEQRYGPGSTYANLSPRERWTLIEMQQLESSAADKTGLYAHRLANIGTKCAPDRSIR